MLTIISGRGAGAGVNRAKEYRHYSEPGCFAPNVESRWPSCGKKVVTKCITIAGRTTAPG
ncbi:hypothetical protein ACFLWE_01350 [Chloroflexota bacterium]